MDCIKVKIQLLKCLQAQIVRYLLYLNLFTRHIMYMLFTMAVRIQDLGFFVTGGGYLLGFLDNISHHI